MKRFFVCFAVFAAMFFAVSCGGSSTTGDNTDTGTTETDEDSADSGSADTGTTEPTDTGEPDTAPDNGDSTPDNDTDSGDTAPDYDNGNSTPDSDPSDPINENPDNLPECSPTSSTPCIDSQALDADSEKAYLIWSAKSPERLRWIDAIDYCNNLNEGGFNDWLIPPIAALRTLHSTYCDFGSCSKFGDIAFFWSAAQGYGVDFYNNGQSTSKNVDENFDVRCVRKEITSRQANCTSELPENAEWNTVSKITQTWNWFATQTNDGYKEMVWTPSLITYHSEEPSTTRCLYKCKDNFLFDVIHNWPGYNDFICSGGYDPSSGLTWSKKTRTDSGDLDMMKWGEAVSYCDDLTEGGSSDWHLPTIDELKTLLVWSKASSCKVSEDNNCLSSGCWSCSTCTEHGTQYSDGTGCSDWGEDHYSEYHSKFGDSYDFWSSSIDDGGNAWFVDFGYGYVSIKDTYNMAAKYVRCVKCEKNYVFDSASGKCLLSPCESNPCDTLTTITDTTCIARSYSNYSCSGKDPASGLIWSAKAGRKMDLYNAVSYCYNLIEGGYSDWRLPNIDELRTLLIADRVKNNCQVSETNNCLSDKDCWSCSTCTQTGTQSSSGSGCSDWGTSYSDGRYSRFGDINTFWSSSTISDNTDIAWLVDFRYGSVDNGYKTGNFHVRCVR